MLWPLGFSERLGCLDCRKAVVVRFEFHFRITDLRVMAHEVSSMCRSLRTELSS